MHIQILIATSLWMPYYLLQVFEDGLDPDSLFDRLKEESLSEKKNIAKTPKPRKVRFML